MITGFFINIFYTIVSYGVNLLPESAFPQTIIDAWVYMWRLINAVNFLFPVSHLIVILGLWFLLMKTKLIVLLARMIARASRGHLG